jgi:nucleoside-diphosphate-sugar epimerase
LETLGARRLLVIGGAGFVRRRLVARALLPGLEGDAFNIASGVPVTIDDLARTVNDLTGNPAGIEFVPQREWDRSLARTVAWTADSLDRIERSIGPHRAFCPADF